jgi:hypothetical protein
MAKIAAPLKALVGTVLPKTDIEPVTALGEPIIWPFEAWGVPSACS